MDRLTAVLLVSVAIPLFVLAFLLGGVAVVPALVASVLLTLLAILVAVLAGMHRRMRGLVVLAILSIALSLCCAIVLGMRATGGAGGAILATMGWLITFPLAVRIMRGTMVTVQRGTFIIIESPLMGSRVLGPQGGIFGPLVPFLENMSAVLPAYELCCKIEGESVKTQALYDAVVDVSIYYEIFDPVIVVYDLPNREKTIAEVLGEAFDTEEALHVVSNWEKIIERTLRQEVTTALRNVLSPQPGPVDVFFQQVNLGPQVRRSLSAMTSRWGVRVQRVEIEKVELHPASIQWFYKDTFMVMDDSIAHAEAQRRADALEVIEGMRTKMGLEMLDRLLQVIQKNITLPNKDIITLCLQATEQMFGPRRRYSLEVDPGALASIDKLVEAIKGREEVSH